MAKLVKRGTFGLSVLFGFVSWLVLGLAWTKAPEGGYADKVIGALFAPGYRAGHFVGELFFPNYEVPHTTGWYLMPLFGAAGTFVFLAAIFYACIRFKRAFQPEEVESVPMSDYESIEARRKHGTGHFDGEHEPDYNPKERPLWYGRVGGLLDLIDRDRFKLRVWREFHDHTGSWPLLSICFHYGMLVGGVVGTIVFLWLKDNHDWGVGPSIAVGISLGVLYLVLFVLGEGLMRKVDWRLFGKPSRNL